MQLDITKGLFGFDGSRAWRDSRYPILYKPTGRLFRACSDPGIKVTAIEENDRVGWSGTHAGTFNLGWLRPLLAPIDSLRMKASSHHGQDTSNDYTGRDSVKKYFHLLRLK
jgi:hypothetical protein